MKKWQIQIGFTEREEKDYTERYQQMLNLINTIKTHLLIDQRIIQSGLVFDDVEIGVFPPNHPRNKQ